MQGKQFLYFLIDQEGRSYHVENGIVKTSSVPVSLDYTPDGWQNISIKWERNTKYWGVQRNFTTPFSFVKDGAQILRYIYFSKSIEEKVYLLINKQSLEYSDTEYAYLHKFFYRGEIDLTTYKQTDIEDGFKVSVNILEGGLSQALKAREGITYEIPCNKSSLGTVKIIGDGIDFYNTLNFQPFEFQEHFGTYHYVPIAFLEEDGESSGIAYQTQGYEEWNTSDKNINDSENWLIETTDSPLTINLSGQVIVKLISSFSDEPLNYFLEATYPTGGDTYFSYTLASSVISVGETKVYNINQDLVIPAGKKYFITARSFTSTPISDLVWQATYLDASLFVRFKTRFKTTMLYGLKPKDLFRDIMENIGNPDTTVTSNILDQNSNLIVTCGNALRGLPDAVIKSSLNKFFSSFSIILDAGLSTRFNTVEMESRAKYFDGTNPIALGKIKTFIVEPYKEQLANTIKIGYPDQTYDTVNGKQEFNTSQQYSSPITRITKELNFAVEYRADIYGIEKARQEYTGKQTTDSSSDNDTFIINCEQIKIEASILGTAFLKQFKFATDFSSYEEFIEAGTKISVTNSDLFLGTYTINTISYEGGFVTITVLEPTVTSGVDNGVIWFDYYKPKRVTYDSITGLIAPATAYNIEQLTPKRLLYTNGRFIRSVFWKFEGEKLKFQTTDKNSALKTVKGLETYQENADVQIGKFATPYFIPVIFSFKCSAPINLVELLAENPNRCFSFEYQGNVYKGFNISSGISPTDNEDQEFKLLSAPDNDLNLLING